MESWEYERRKHKTQRAINTLVELMLISILIVIGSFIWDHIKDGGTIIDLNYSITCKNPEAVKILEDNGVSYYSTNKCSEIDESLLQEEEEATEEEVDGGAEATLNKVKNRVYMRK